MRTVLVSLAFALGLARAFTGAETLDDPSQEVRDRVAGQQRSSFHRGEARHWQPLMDKLVPGLTLDQVRSLLGPPQDARKPGFGYMNGQAYSWRLDDTWMLDFEIGRFEPGLRKASLVPRLREFYTQPPPGFTGAWRDFYISGSLYMETRYLRGLRDGKQVIYSDSGSIQAVQHYKMGALDGEILGYHPNGALQHRCFYENGTPAGPTIHYNERGEETSRTGQGGQHGAAGGP